MRKGHILIGHCANNIRFDFLVKNIIIIFNLIFVLFYRCYIHVIIDTIASLHL